MASAWFSHSPAFLSSISSQILEIGLIYRLILLSFQLSITKPFYKQGYDNPVPDNSRMASIEA